MKCPHCKYDIPDASEICPQCERSLVGAPQRQPTVQQLPPTQRVHVVNTGASVVARMFYIFALLGAIGGTLIGIGGAVVSTGAPQQAAAAGIGCLVVIAPYVLARAVDELTRSSG